MIEARGLPLHQISTGSGIHEDDLLDILNQRKPLSKEQFESLCKCLEDAPVAVELEELSAREENVLVAERLKCLRDLDSELLQSIRKLGINEAAARNDSALQWEERLSTLVELYNEHQRELSGAPKVRLPLAA